MGNEAVIVFFVLSGFLVGGSSISKMLINKFDVFSYTVDRVVRIYVPLIPALFFSGLVGLYLGNSINYIELVGNVLQLQGVFFEPFSGNGPLWSLAYECWFYFVIPFFYYLIKNNKFSFFLLLGVLLFFLVLTKLQSVYFYCWLIGAFAFFNLPERFKWKNFLFSVLLMVIGVASIQVNTASQSVQVGFVRDFFPSIDIAKLVLSIGCALFIRTVSVANPSNYIFKKIEGSGKFLADFSFTLYLIHYPVLKLISPFLKINNGVIDIYSYAHLVFTVLTCIVVSYLFYCFFESKTAFVKVVLKNKLLSFSLQCEKIFGK